jgi:hypothetical protein
LETLDALDQVPSTKEKNKFHVTKLTKTIKSMLVKFNNKSKKKHLKKVVIKFPYAISNKFFSPGAPDGVLTVLPLPYIFEHETKGKKVNAKARKFTSTETTLVWRPFIVDSDRPIEDEVDSDDSDLDERIANLLGNLTS